MGPKERKRLLKPLQQRVDRSHRGIYERRLRWTTLDKVVLVLDIVLAVGAMVLAVVLFLL